MEFNHKDRTFIVGMAAFIFTIGLLIGYGTMKFGTEETIATLQSDNEIAHEQLMAYESELADNYKKLTECQEDLILEYSNNQQLQNELLTTTSDLNTLKEEEYEFVYMGDFKLTHYCTERYKHICGTGNGITATNTEVTAGRTIAVDPRVIPYGTTVYIEGYGFRVAEDCGGAVKSQHIDIAVETHTEALNIGTKTGGVWLLVKKTS